MTTPLPHTLPQMLRHAAQRFGERPAIVDGDVTIRYRELVQRGEQVARSLIALGVQADDRVAIWAPNVHEWILAACGVHAAGAVLVPINTRMKGAEAADILERSRSRVLVCIAEFLGQDFSRFAHNQPRHRIGQAELEGRHWLEMPRPKLHHRPQPLP